MFISISDEEVTYSGGKKYVLKDSKYLVVFESPNHIKNEIILNQEYAEITKYADIFPSDSILFVDPLKKKIVFLRDWPGNIQSFYFLDKDKKQFHISDDITHLVKKIKNIKPSFAGIQLFLNYRKHYHSHTIYGNVEMLHPGLMIEIDHYSFSFEVKPWYLPFRQIEIKNKQNATGKYIEAIDNSLMRLVTKDNPIALMFSGGSDSTFLLDRLIKSGFTNINLFAICIKDNTSQIDYAIDKAKHFNLSVTPIIVDKKEVLKSWTKLYEICYHYLSDLRIDGIFSSAVLVFEFLRDYFKNEPVTIIWGSQYALISPVISAKAIVSLRLLSLIKKISDLVFIPSKIITTLFLFVVKNVPVLDRKQVSEQTYQAYKSLYSKCFGMHHNATQLIDMVLSTNYNYCKHWWMDWRGKVKNIYYPEAKNVYPFHDRTFQEASMPIDLNVRIGGWKNIFTMPKEYKHFFYSLLPSNIPISSVKRGNYKTLPEYFSLFKNEQFYNTLLEYLNDPKNKKLVDLVLKKNNISIPYSYENFLKLDYQQVEKLSGILFLIIRFRTDGVDL
ncbi:MAG: hypothetical protein KF721_09530 [Ignavibacteriaceae bacterium]|nr:hypothetical protein [Ignavibacteriaceae bacterium]